MIYSKLGGVPVASNLVIKNQVGRKHGRWTVILYVGKVPNSPFRYWKCRCKCGIIKIVSSNMFYNPKSQSCGCLQRELARKSHLKHGMSGTTEYITWSNMISRCHNKDNKDYHSWGGRGIRVCSRWRTSFSAFFKDMGKRPAPHYRLDRRDNDGPYAPWNCRWVTPKEQSRNKRDTIFLTIDRVTKSLSEWAEISGLPYYLIHRRYKRYGWSAKRAVFEKIGPSGTRRDK